MKDTHGHYSDKEERGYARRRWTLIENCEQPEPAIIAPKDICVWDAFLEEYNVRTRKTKKKKETHL